MCHKRVPQLGVGKGVVLQSAVAGAIGTLLLELAGVGYALEYVVATFFLLSS